MERGELMLVPCSEEDRFGSWYLFLCGPQAEKGLQEASLWQRLFHNLPMIHHSWSGYRWTRTSHHSNLPMWWQPSFTGWLQIHAAQWSSMHLEWAEHTEKYRQCFSFHLPQGERCDSPKVKRASSLWGGCCLPWFCRRLMQSCWEPIVRMACQVPFLSWPLHNAGIKP